MVRVGKDVHARAAMAAEISGKSLAKWAEDVIDRAARQTLESTVLA
ncbi:toxin-antitoxin system HicB family antitoxin [Caulobacter sp. 73W]|uniref:Toxin-antitoxin system HicB family antitoxin n=1 Tax=Caulobacter sp. 73W TaxID=3161137 RepID=A0AB39KWV0_9CAUL